MHNGIGTAIVALLMGLINPVLAQQQIFKNYTVNDGLISNSVRRVLQDSMGYLWIATWEGLSKYDGHSFTNYSTANGLSHNFVNDFYEEKNGRLYVALNNGAIDIITENKVIKNPVPSVSVVNRFIHKPNHPTLATTDANGIQEFRNGKLFRPQQTASRKSFLELIWLNDSVFMAVGDSIIKVYHKNYTQLAETSNHFPVHPEYTIYQDSKKRIWVGTYNGLKLMAGQPQKKNPVTFILPPPPFNITALKQKKVTSILEEENGTLWFGTTGGLVKVNPNGTHQLITTNDGLSSNIISSIFQDKEKNIWFGTAVGLSKLVARSGISLYPMTNGVWNNDNLFLIHQFKKNELLVSTFTGTVRFNKLTGEFIPTANHPKDPFYSVIAGSHPPVFIGFNKMATFDTLALRFNKTTALPFLPAVRITRDKQGGFFYSKGEQLFFSTGKTQYKLLDHRISALLIDKKGDVWAGTWQNGLYRIRYSYVDKRFNVFATGHFLPDENIRCLYEDSKGNMWAGTRYQGVYRLVENKKNVFTISKFDQSNGLTSNFIKGIREDANGNFWIAFYQGLDKLMAQDNSFRIFNFSRINNYFASIIGMQTDEDHSIWLATGEGLAHINDGELEKLPPLPVYITKIYSPDSVYSLHANRVNLNYRQNQLQFEFSAPGFINEKQVVYSYRLSGSSLAKWTEGSNQHKVSYASLQPGSYVFEVRTLGWNGVWGKPASFEFLISPPFWQTWWFISLVLLCTILVIYWFIKWREKNIKLIETGKLKVQQLSAEQYKSKLELEQIINYFSSSLIDKNTVEDVLWDVAKNLIGRLGFVDCMIYLWDDGKNKMIQKAGFGPKGSIEEIIERPFDVLPGQGIVGFVMQSKEPLLIPDTTKDKRYRPDEMERLSEITVPVIYNTELLGVIDSEHHEKNFYTPQHLQILSTIATLVGNKIKSIEAEQLLQRTQIEMYSMNEQLLKAKLEALRAQMNPHFIFNCLNSIDNLIQMDEKEKATLYLSKFAKLIRSILENATNTVVSCWKDMETLHLYLELEALRFDNKFSYEVNVSNEIMNGDYKVPSLVIQPFVENAIHHGLLNKIDHDKKLQVDVSVFNNHIHYRIEDNGVGRAKASSYKQLNKPAYESMGIQITADRIKLFNRHTNGSVKITDLHDENGTPVGTKVEVELINQP